MIQYQQEPLCTVVPDVDSLLSMHYEELTLNKDKIKLQPVWSRYAALEQAGAFVCFTARDDEKLIGYSAFFVNAHLHYEQTIVASNDVLFLHPDYRQGMTGIKLIKFSESQLKSMNVNKITWHAKHNTALIPILERLGYKNEEVVMGKIF
jgi:GNAT superfamily N-acetyltransferase